MKDGASASDFLYLYDRLPLLTLPQTRQIRDEALRAARALPGLVESKEYQEAEEQARLLLKLLRKLPPELGGVARAAVVLMSLPPEASAVVFSCMGAEAVQRIVLEISRLPAVSDILRRSVVEPFCRGLGVGDLAALIELARREPERVAREVVALLPV